MPLFVDTGVWSLAFRRDTPADSPHVAALRHALAGVEFVTTSGIVPLELLRGFVPPRAQDSIKSALGALDLVEPARDDYVEAAAISSTCRRNGVQFATVDALMAQLCISTRLLLLTTDQDFVLAAQHVPVQVWRQ